MPDLQEGTEYKIVNAKSDTILDISGTDVGRVIGFSYHGGDNQRWTVERNGDQYHLKTASGQYIGIEGEPNNGEPVRAINQPFAFDIRPDENHGGCWKIFVPNTDQCVDLSDHGNSEPGTLVTLWVSWNAANQAWRFENA